MNTEPSQTPAAVNLDLAFGKIDQYWTPRIAAELNGQQVKLAKLLGEFDWHQHDDEDELFLVWRGEFEMQLRTGNLTLREGEMFVVPRGVPHRPVATEEAWVLLFEPATTLNTGNVRTEKTVLNPERLD